MQGSGGDGGGAPRRQQVQLPAHYTLACVCASVYCTRLRAPTVPMYLYKTTNVYTGWYYTGTTHNLLSLQISRYRIVHEPNVSPLQYSIP